MEYQTVTVLENQWEEIGAALRYRAERVTALAASIDNLNDDKRKELTEYAGRLRALANDVDKQRPLPIASRKATSTEPKGTYTVPR